MNSRLVHDSNVAEKIVRVHEWPTVGAEFVASYVPVPDEPPEKRRFPRDWIEVERLVEERLRDFAERHRLEREAEFARGVQEGMRQREAAAQEKLQAAGKILQRLDEKVANRLAEQQGEFYRETADLVAALGDFWLGQMVQINPMTFLAALRDALAPLSHMDDVEVHLNPTDYRTLTEGIAADEQEFLAYQHLRVVADRAVTAGGVTAESKGGRVDARLETRIRRALELLNTVPHDD